MVWDKTLPIEGALAPTYNDIMRADKTALEAALNAYMYFVTGGVQTGQPRQGSSRPYYQAAAPTTRLDGDYFDSTDYGTPWIDSDNNKVYFLSSADGAGTDAWTLDSTEIIATLLAAARIFASTLKSTGDFTVGANKLVVTAATGNTVIAGTLGVTGVATVAKGSLSASTDAPTTNAMLANKKYVDDSIAPYVVLKDIKTAGTAGGSSVADTWTKRTVAEITDSGSICTVSSSVVVLSAGTYFCRISAPSYNSQSHQIRLRNTTGASTLLTGSSAGGNVGYSANSRSEITGVFTVAASQNLEIQHNVQTSRATNGFGYKADFTGVEEEVYTVAEFWKVG